jgi:hypothetical protein
MKHKIFYVFFILLLICITVFLRVYRISELAEFLGDQGVTGIMVYDSIQNRELPLTGLKASNGSYQGPAYLYIFTPLFVLSKFNPAAVSGLLSIFAVMTVLLILHLGTKFFGSIIGYALAMLYAISPEIISQNRTIWNPTLIPFFSILFSVCVYKLFRTKNNKWWVVIGAVLAVLIQFHYSCYFFIPFTVCVWVYYVHNQKKENVRHIVIYSLLGFFLFFIFLSPFILHLFKTNFTDMVLFVASLSEQNPAIVGKLQFIQNLLSNFLTNIVALLHIYLPFPKLTFLLILPILLVTTVTFIQRKSYLFFIAWFTSGLFISTILNPGNHLHYMAYLFIPALFILGFLLLFIKKYIRNIGIIILLITVVIFSIKDADVFKRGSNDIPKTINNITVMNNLSKNNPYSFALIASKSWSDTHYKYFYKINKKPVYGPYDPNISTLFLICDKSPCPDEQSFINKKSFEVLCDSFHCDNGFPVIDLTTYSFQNKIQNMNSTIYVFSKIVKT